MVLRGISHLQTMHPGLRLMPGNIPHLPKPQPGSGTPVPPGPHRSPFPREHSRQPGGTCTRVGGRRDAERRRRHRQPGWSAGSNTERKTAGARRGGGCGRAGQRRTRSLLRRARGLPGSLRRVLASLRASPCRATLGRQRSLPLQPSGSAPLAEAPAEGPRWLQTPRCWARDSKQPRGREAK